MSTIIMVSDSEQNLVVLFDHLDYARAVGFSRAFWQQVLRRGPHRQVVSFILVDLLYLGVCVHKRNLTVVEKVCVESLSHIHKSI